MPISPSEAQKIANEILQGSLTERPWFYITFLTLTFISGAAGAFLTGYFKKRGESLATRADFESLRDQLKQNTHLAEEIKADVQTRYGERASIRALLRERAEALVMATFDLEVWLNEAQNRAFQGNSSDYDSSPMSKISAFREIYFPEISAEYDLVKAKYLSYASWLVELRQVSLEARGDQAQLQRHLDRFGDAYTPFYASLAQFRTRVIAAAKARGGL